LDETGLKAVLQVDKSGRYAVVEGVVAFAASWR